MQLTAARILVFLVGGCLGLACSGGGDDGPVDPGGGPLDGVTLPVSSSVSFGKIYLQGMPSPKGAPSYAARLSVGGEIIGDMLVESDEGGFFIYAPLHPLTPNDGGSVEIQVHGGEEESGILPLDVEALPEAPGAFEAVVNTLRAHIAQRAEAEGTTFEELAATSFEAVAPQLFRLKLAQSYVDSDADVDMVSMIANENGFLTADERELLDRLFGYIAFAEVVQLDIDHMAAGKLPPPGPRAVGGRSAKRECIDTRPEITTAGELSVAMLRSRLSQIAIDPEGRAGELLSAAGTVITGGSFIPRYGIVFSILGTGVASWQASREYYAGVYPDHFTALIFDLDKAEYNEDEIAPGRWDNVKATAASDGFVADRAIANVVVNALGTYVSGAASSGMQNLDFLDGAAMTGLNVGLDSYLEAQGTEFIEFCGGSWTVDITGVPFSTGGVLNRRFSVDVETRSLLPAEVGADFLVVAAQANQFGGRTIEAARPVEVKAIDVRLDSADYYVSTAGETIDITATIANANRTWLTWSTEKGSFDDGLGLLTNDGATRPLKTPLASGDYPFTVKVESASTLGIRGLEGAEPREATARVRLRQGLSVEPAYVCVKHQESQQFTALGAEGAELHWEVVDGPGSIDANGLYVAPDSGIATAVVGVWLADNPQINAMATVDIASCDCFIDVTVSGDSQWDYQDTNIAYYIVDQAGSPYYQINIQVPVEEGRSISGHIWLGPGGLGPYPGDSGLYPAGFSYSEGEQTWQVWYEDFNVDITKLTGSYMTGVFEGPLVIVDQMGETISTVQLRAEFRALRYEAFGPGGSWPCE